MAHRHEPGPAGGDHGGDLAAAAALRLPGHDQGTARADRARLLTRRRATPQAALSAEAGQVARGSAVNIAAMTVGAGLSFALTVLCTRWLQPELAGEFFEMIAFFTIISAALQLGADTGLTRWIARARSVGGLAETRRVALVALVPIVIIGALVIAAVWFGAPLLARLFLHNMAGGQAASDFRLITFFVPLNALSVCLIAGARGFGRMWPYLGIEGLGKPVLRISFVVFALVAGWSLRGAVLAWSIPVALGIIAAWLIFERLVSSEVPAAIPALSPAGRGGLAAEFWRFAAPRGFAAIFQIVVLWVDVLLVGAILNSYQAGIYAAVSRLALIGTFALEGTRLATAPRLSESLARREHGRARDLYQSATRLLILASWPVYLLFAIFPAVTLGIFGGRYTAGASALVIIALAMLINTGTGNVTVVLLMGGRSSWNVVNTFAALSVNIGLNVLLLPRIGIAGAAIAWAASIVVDNLAAVIEVWWIFGIGPAGRGYGLVVTVAAACFGLTGLGARELLGPTVTGLAAAAAAGLLIYGPVVYLSRKRLRVSGLYAAMRPGRPPVPSRQPGRHRAPAQPRRQGGHAATGSPHLVAGQHLSADRRRAS